jgi:hypothetical protein
VGALRLTSACDERRRHLILDGDVPSSFQRASPSHGDASWPHPLPKPLRCCPSGLPNVPQRNYTAMNHDSPEWKAAAERLRMNMRCSWRDHEIDTILLLCRSIEEMDKYIGRIPNRPEPVDLTDNSTHRVIYFSLYAPPTFPHNAGKTTRP